MPDALQVANQANQEVVEAGKRYAAGLKALGLEFGQPIPANHPRKAEADSLHHRHCEEVLSINAKYNRTTVYIRDHHKKICPVTSDRFSLFHTFEGNPVRNLFLLKEGIWFVVDAGTCWGEALAESQVVDLYRRHGQPLPGELQHLLSSATSTPTTTTPAAQPNCQPPTQRKACGPVRSQGPSSQSLQVIEFLAMASRLVLDGIAPYLTAQGTTEADQIAVELLKLACQHEEQRVESILNPLYADPNPSLRNEVNRAMNMIVSAASRRAAMEAISPGPPRAPSLSAALKTKPPAALAVSDSPAVSEKTTMPSTRSPAPQHSSTSQYASESPAVRQVIAYLRSRWFEGRNDVSSKEILSCLIARGLSSEAPTAVLRLEHLGLIGPDDPETAESCRRLWATYNRTTPDPGSPQLSLHSILYRIQPPIADPGWAQPAGEEHPSTKELARPTEAKNPRPPLSTLQQRIQALRDAALAQLEIWQFFSWASTGGDARDPAGRTPVDCVADLGRSCWLSIQPHLQDALECFALVSRQPRANFYARGRSTTEFVFNHSLTLARLIASSTPVNPIRTGAFDERENGILHAAVPTIFEAMNNSEDSLFTFSECGRLRAEVEWEATRAIAWALAAQQHEKEPTPIMPGMTGLFELFYSYTHKDESLRDELEKHLSVLKHQGLISGWHDRKIGAGKEWEGEIDKHLNSARIVLLLISSDFLASGYCYGVETKRALERHTAGEARVIPVILRPCDWQHSPIGKLLALPKDGFAVTSWRNLDEAFTDVAKGIRAAIEELAKDIR